jgi:glyoxylase I family protein
MIKLHHINICGDDIDASVDFYRNVLGFDPLAGAERLNNARVLDQGSTQRAAFLDLGTAQLHANQRDLDVSFKTGRPINPIANGHIAFRTDDLAGIKQRLDERGIHYADFGEWAIEGWHQIFLYDPSGTVIEIHEVTREDAPE